MFTLLILLLVFAIVLLHVLVEEVALFLLDLVQLRLERFNRLFQLLLVFLQLLGCLICLFTLFDSTLDQHIDVLQYLILGCHSLNSLILLIRDPVLLINLLLKFTHLGL